MILRINKRTITPDNKRTIVKLDQSIARSPNANRQRTEFAAKAIKAKPVKIVVFANEIFEFSRRANPYNN